MFLFELFAAVSWGLVAVVLIGIIAIGSCLENDEPLGATAAFIVAAAIIGTVVYDWQTSLNFLLTIPQNVGWIAIYLVVGVVWSIFKWGFFVRDLASQLAENLADTQKTWGGSSRETFVAERLANYRNSGSREEIEAEYSKRYRDSIASSINAALSAVISNRFDGSQFERDDITIEEIFKKIDLTAGNRKALISSWVAFWPVSMTTTAIREFVINLISNIVEAFQGVYNRISKMIIGNALKAAVEQAAEIKKVEAVKGA